MKLALIRRQFSATGGAELYVQRLLKAMADRGHELHFFAEHWQDPPPGVVITTIPVRGNRANRPVDFARGVSQALQTQTFDCVFSFERTWKQDVYRAGDGVHAAWLHQRRHFAPWWQKPFTRCGAFHRNMLALERKTFQPANTRHVIVNSDRVRRDIIEEFDFPEDRIHIVRNGVDVDRFQSGRREETRARFGFKQEDMVLLFVGSGWERKGLRYAIRALEQLALRQSMEILQKEWRGEGLPPRQSRHCAKLLVVGKGRKPWWTPEDVVFAGSMKDVENAYAAADIFLFLPIYEPSANVVAEAMAAGLPVITSEQNGASEVVEDGVNGTVVTDPSDMRQVVDALVDWSSRRFSMHPADTDPLRLDRNVDETVRILELAAREKRRTGA